jgi:CRISPR-associated protein Csd1
MAPDAKGKPQARPMSVPAVKRTSGIKPAILWDKTAYALGITSVKGNDGKPLKNGAGDPIPGQGPRTEAEHAAFREAHLDLLADATAPGLVALRRFVERWSPGGFSEDGHPPSVIDQNLVFRFGDDLVHDLPEAAALLLAAEGEAAPCLVTGREGPTARLHPSIKGVMGAQSSGASLVSFNNDAEASHGKKQGENAPVSEAAAFAYGTALNALLAKGSRNSLRVGDATVAFWAHGAGEEEAEDLFAQLVSGPVKEDDAGAENRVRTHLAEVAAGRMPAGTGLDPATRVFALGLAPNAARLAVRFWHPGTLGDLARHVARFWEECAIEPSPFRTRAGPRPPRPWALLYETALQGKAENIPPLLGGGLMRAVLTGGPYPRTLLTAVIGRIRADREDTGKPLEQRGRDGRRAAIIRAVLLRTNKEEVPMALDEGATDVAYLLGRLFGAYVYAEKSHQDRGATLRDKYMGSASATPARVFPVLMRGYEHNLSSLRKAGGNKAGAGVRADRAVAAILAALPGGEAEGAMPAALPLEDQGRFFIGFYHQLSAFYAKPEEAAEALIEDETEDAA